MLRNPNPPRPRIYRLRVEDPDKAIDDPGLALLAATGWTVAGSFSAEERSGTEVRHLLVLVLWPPREDASRGSALVLPALVAAAVVVEVVQAVAAWLP